MVLSQLRNISNLMFGKYLLVTNVVGVSCMLATGDTIEQRVIQRILKGEKVKQQDWNRTGRMFVSGITFGTVAHFWYGWLDLHFPGTTLRRLASKMALDTTIGIPLTNVTWFFSIGLLDGMNVRESARNSVIKLPPIIVGEIAFWGPAQAINFYFLPPRFRVMYLGVVSLVWTSYMAFIQYEYGKEPEEREGEACMITDIETNTGGTT